MLNDVTHSWIWSTYTHDLNCVTSIDVLRPCSDQLLRTLDISTAIILANENALTVTDPLPNRLLAPLFRHGNVHSLNFPDTINQHPILSHNPVLDTKMTSLLANVATRALSFMLLFCDRRPFLEKAHEAFASDAFGIHLEICAHEVLRLEGFCVYADIYPSLDSAVAEFLGSDILGGVVCLRWR